MRSSTYTIPHKTKKARCAILRVLTDCMNLVEHKKARLNYETLEEFEAGLVLTGPEVKSLRLGQAKLDGSHVIVRPTGRGGGLEAYVVGMYIAPYQHAAQTSVYDPDATRKLLMNKKELRVLADSAAQKGLTLVPLSVYNKGRNVKLKLAVARGRRTHDKREVLKKRDAQRDIERTLKTRHR